MYGNIDAYFGSPKEGYCNSIWIELIGFDREKENFLVDEYIENIGFKPQRMSLHLTSVDFVNTHKGMDSEYVLPAYACSYAGHPCNDDRLRQDWTNYEMRELIKKLQSKGIEVYASFFDMEAETGTGEKKFSELHPELLAICTNKAETEKGIMMIKRFADGTYYEDYLLEKLKEVCRDYGFDGVQIADGLSSPRNAIWFADFSDDIIEQSGIEIPAGVEDKAKYINENCRKEWVQFYRNRWNGFLTKIIKGLKEAGIKTAVNSAWTRDPLESVYRYGTDYRAIKEAGADYLVVEDVSSDLAILGFEDNHNYDLGMERRRFIHHEFIANLMLVKAQVGDMPITPLFMLWDNQEQWSVIHHIPTAMQRAAAVNFAKQCMVGGKWVTPTSGPHFCLGDALSKHDWDFIRLAIDNGYTPGAENTGATFIWSDARMENELDALINNGNMHSALWLATLTYKGAMIGGAADIGELDNLTGTIVVANPSLMPENELEKIKNYKNGNVVYVEDISTADVLKVTNPVDCGWPRPLEIVKPDLKIVEEAVEKINENAPSAIVKDFTHCVLVEVKTGENTSKIFVDNEEYYYVLPTIRTKRKIKSIKIITKPDGYPLRYTENEFTVRVPGRGVDIAEITWAD